MTLVYRRRSRAKMKNKKQKRSNLLLHDPIFMHHVLACISRCLELSLPGEPSKIDAGYHLVTPEGTGQQAEKRRGKK